MIPARRRLALSIHLPLLLLAACRPPADREAAGGPAPMPSAALAANATQGPDGALASHAGPDIGGVPSPWHLTLPWVGQAEPAPGWGGSDAPDGADPVSTAAVAPTATAGPAAPATDGSAADATGPCAGLVGRRGAELVLGSQPLHFFGINATYLTETDFPEDQVPGILKRLHDRGVGVVRVWFQAGQDPERLARLLDGGGRLGLRFIVTLGDNVHQGVDWFFGEEDDKRFQPHVERTVTRFKDRPEILAWEPVNEPNCGDGRFDAACVKTIRDWVVGTSRTIKDIDSCHLISSGMIGAGNYDLDRDSYKRLHKKDEIDLISVHRDVGADAALERALSADIGKPIFYGETYDVANDDSCQALRGGEGPAGRARRVADDLAQAWADGVDGYLLWDLNVGLVRKTNGDDGYYCSKFGYAFDDPLWTRLAERQLLP